MPVTFHKYGIPKPLLATIMNVKADQKYANFGTHGVVNNHIVKESFQYQVVVTMELAVHATYKELHEYQHHGVVRILPGG